MPFPTPGNPNPYPPWPPPQAGQFPGGNWLMQQWGNALQRTPWNVQPGLQQIPHQFPVNPFVGGGMLTTPVADIYSFTKKGLLGVPGTEGAGGRGLGSRGGGLLGGRYNFRDPQSVAQYEKDRGLPPGSIKPVEAQVTTIAPPGGGPQRDFGKYNAKVTDPRMLTPEARREAGIDAAMRKAQMGHDAETARRIAARRGAKEGPTGAQMARPVKQTPEISAKLKDARFARWAIGHAGPHWKNLSPEQLTALRAAWEQVHGGK